MITNEKVTIYHMNGLDATTHLETWTRYNYDNAWFFGERASSMDKGYNDNNGVQVRLPYDANSNLDISHFSIGDIIVKGELDTDIETQQDLSNYLIYNITSIKNNDFGNNKHIHLGGQ